LIILYLMNSQGVDTFHTLRYFLTTTVESFPDIRCGKNSKYSMKNITLSAFAVFEPLVANLVTTDVEILDLFRHTMKTNNSRFGADIGLMGAGFMGVDPDASI